MDASVSEPTAEQCSANEKVFEDEDIIGYAIWYPQMGGYVGKAVVLLDKKWTEFATGAREGGCFSALVWHDGKFPFSGEDEGIEPIWLHHCDPEQFIKFGKKVAELNERGRCGPNAMDS
jgi:hypothetical protein